MINNELEIIWKEATVAYSRYYSGIFLEGQRKIMQYLNQYSWCLEPDSNLTPPEYKPGELPQDQLVR
jgi:hypothetical protein